VNWDPHPVVVDIRTCNRTAQEAADRTGSTVQLRRVGPACSSLLLGEEVRTEVEDILEAGVLQCNTPAHHRCRLHHPVYLASLRFHLGLLLLVVEEEVVGTDSKLHNQDREVDADEDAAAAVDSVPNQEAHCRHLLVVAAAKLKDPAFSAAAALHPPLARPEDHLAAFLLRLVDRPREEEEHHHLVPAAHWAHHHLCPLRRRRVSSWLLLWFFSFAWVGWPCLSDDQINKMTPSRVRLLVRFYCTNGPKRM